MEDYSVSKDELQKGGELFELFWLRPKLYKDQIVTIRLRINKKWGGWKLKDELVELLGLEVGDTISTEVTPLFMSGRIDDADDMDLFATGKGADWLLEHDVKMGSIIDCRVRFSYSKVPVGANGKEVNKASLIFEEGICVVEVDSKYIEGARMGVDVVDDILRRLRE